MNDENAFGLLISYFDLEDDEYGGERADFVERYTQFGALLGERLAQTPPGAAARALELGHALYVELLEDDEPRDPIAWLRETRAALTAQSYRSAGVLTFGATWREEGEPEVRVVGGIRLLRASLPSEPFRRALLAEAATRADEESDVEGWGPGLYLDVDAVEALGRKPKNEPTVLRAGSVSFYRVGA